MSTSSERLQYTGSHERVSSHQTVDNLTDLSFLYSFDQMNDELFPQIGGKGASLVLLRKVGLPVPAGYSVSTDVHAYYMEKGELPNGLVTEIARVKKSFGGKIIIRSSANCEDGMELSMAGVFESHRVYADEEIPDVLKRIYGQSRSPEVAQFLTLHGKSPESVRMGLVVQELVEPEAAGVVYTGVNGNNILIQYVDGYGATLVDGETGGSAILVNGDDTIIESAGFETRPLAPGVVRQIAQYTHTITNLFSGVPQNIEFACRDGKVYIVQARTLTADLGHVDLRVTPEESLEATKHKLRGIAAIEKRDLGTPTAIFSDANYSELLPRPTEMDVGIHMYVWGGSDGIPGAKQLGHAAMGYLVGDEANPLVYYFGGRTYFSIARYAGLYHVGFPETKQEYYDTLVHEYLKTVELDPQRGSYPQMGLYLQDPTMEDLQTRYGDRAMEYFQVYQDFASRMHQFADEYLSEFYSTRLPETVRFISFMQGQDVPGMTNDQLVYYAMNILEHNRTASYVDFVKGARLGFYYSQRLQSLLRQKLGVEQEEAQKLYARLNQGLDGSAVTEANIAIADASSEEDAVRVAQERVGHFSSGEMLEIRHVPLRNDPEKLLAYVRGIRQTGQYKFNFEKQRETRITAQEAILARIQDSDREELSHVMHASQTYMALRETAKYYVTKEYLLLRDALELLGKRMGLETGDIYYLYPRELPQFVANPLSMFHLIRARKQSFMNYEQIDMPSVIRESDIDTIGLSTENESGFIEATGKFLAEGPQVQGVIVNSDEFDDLSQVNAVMQQYREQAISVILAATQMNLSHDPLIAQSAGLVIRNAGLVAHGAQRARELGKGAIGGINTKKLKTGMLVLFDPETRSMKRLDTGDTEGT